MQLSRRQIVSLECVLAVLIVTGALAVASLACRSSDRPTNEPTRDVAYVAADESTQTTHAPIAETAPIDVAESDGPESDLSPATIVLCQHKGVFAPRIINGVDCPDGACNNVTWRAARPIPFEVFAQGEYIGPHRLPHVDQYRIRVDDQLEFVYRLTRNISPEAYELNVGDSVRVESEVKLDGRVEKELDREVIIQPDGTITLPLIGQVRAAGRTVDELRKHLEELYKKFFRVPAITVTPLRVNTRLEDLRSTVDARAGAGGQVQVTRVTPEGTVQLPGVGSVPVQGLSLDELKLEINARYAEIVDGIEVDPRLAARAPRYIYVLGEVAAPNRYTIDGPITVMGALAMAGSWLHVGNPAQVVVFRRTDDWRLNATVLDLRRALLGLEPCPADEIWLRDNDIVIVPKRHITRFDEWIERVFSRGLYGIIPVSGSVQFARSSRL